jgi:hypothetical protein
MVRILWMLVLTVLIVAGTHAETVTIDTKVNAILLNSSNAKIVGDLTPNQAYTISVSGTSTGPMQGVFFMLQTPYEHQFRFVKFGQSFTFVPVASSIQLAAFYVDWSSLADNSGSITVGISNHASLTLDPKLDGILLDSAPVTIVGSLAAGSPHAVSVRTAGVTGTPLNGALFMYQESSGAIGFRYVRDGEGFIFSPLNASRQIAAFYVDWSTLQDNTGYVVVQVEPRGALERTVRLSQRTNAALLTSKNSRIVADLTAGQPYRVSVQSTVGASAPMKGAFFMLSTPTEHEFRYVEPGYSFTFVPQNASPQLAAFFTDWANTDDNSGTITVSIFDKTGTKVKDLSLDAKTDAIKLDTITSIQSGLTPIGKRSQWTVSVRDSSSSGTPLTGAFFMYLDSLRNFQFRYIQGGSTFNTRPYNPAIYQVAPFIVDWSTREDNSGSMIVDFYGPSTIESVPETAPARFALDQNFPNPFNPTTTIRFTLASQTRVRLDVYDVLGERVGVLVDDVLVPGEHQVTFDARGLPSGSYFYRITSGGQSKTGTMLLMK